MKIQNEIEGRRNIFFTHYQLYKVSSLYLSESHVPCPAKEYRNFQNLFKRTIFILIFFLRFFILYSGGCESRMFIKLRTENFKRVKKKKLLRQSCIRRGCGSRLNRKLSARRLEHPLISRDRSSSKSESLQPPVRSQPRARSVWIENF